MVIHICELFNPHKDAAYPAHKGQGFRRMFSMKKKQHLEVQEPPDQLIQLGPKLRKFSFHDKLPSGWEFGPMALNGNFHLLVGKSGSGKTKTLNVLSHLKNSVMTQRFLEFLEDNRYSFRLIISHVLNGKEVRIDYQFTVVYKEKFVSEDASQNIKAIEERVTLDGKEILHRQQNRVELAIEPRKEVFIPLIPYSFRTTFGNEQIDPVLQALSDFFAGIRRLNDNSVASIDIELGTPLNIVQPDGRGLSSSFEWMQHEHGEIYQKVLQEFTTMFGSITAIDFKLPTTFNVPFPVMHLSETGVTEQYSILEAAGGIQRVLSILNLIYAPGPISLICIDEIDSNLDALRIAKLLTHVKENRETLPQILAVSHNPYFQDRCGFAEWVVAQRHGSTVAYYSVDEEKMDPLYATGLYENSSLFKNSLYDEPQLPLKAMF
jgi:energy-coupling factor transporter ATP-binding protein EcfA2